MKKGLTLGSYLNLSSQIALHTYRKRRRWIPQCPEPSDSSHNLLSDCHSAFSCDPAYMSGIGEEEEEGRKKLCASNTPNSPGTVFLRFPICSNFPSSSFHGSSDCDSTAAAAAAAGILI